MPYIKIKFTTTTNKNYVGFVGGIKYINSQPLIQVVEYNKSKIENNYYGLTQIFITSLIYKYKNGQNYFFYKKTEADSIKAEEKILNLIIKLKQHNKCDNLGFIELPKKDTTQKTTLPLTVIKPTISAEPTEKFAEKSIVKSTIIKPSKIINFPKNIYFLQDKKTNKKDLNILYEMIQNIDIKKDKIKSLSAKDGVKDDIKDNKIEKIDIGPDLNMPGQYQQGSCGC